jgi:phosphoglycerol transferase MdoB-like AlkP superfamily enzyme
MAYVDYSLKQFFELAKKQDWFERTVFVITADHTPEQSQAGDNNYVLGVYSVPLAFYLPGQQMASRMDEYAQHVDILPTLAAACDTSFAVFSFGRNLLDTNDLPYAANYLNGQYKLIWRKHLLISTDEGPLEWIKLDNDPQADTSDRQTANEAWRFQQAVIQQFRNRMLTNRLHP